MTVALRIALTFGRARERFLERFTAALAGIVTHDLSIPGGLAEAAREPGWGGFGHIVADLAGRTERAEQLSGAMARWPRVFDPGFIASIRAGERSSSLDEVAGLLAADAQLRGELSGLLRRAIVYPMSVFATTLIALAVFGWLSGPAFLAMLDGNQPTWLAPFILFARLALPLAALATVVVAARIAMPYAGPARDQPRRWFDELPLVVPFIGDAYRKATRAMLCRALAIELAASVPLDEALAHAAESSRNPVVRAEFSEHAANVRAGGRLTDRAHRSHVFDPVISSLLDASWGGDQMLRTLARLADSDEQSLRNFVEVSTPLVEVLFLSVVAVLAGATAIAQFGVYYQSLAAFPH